VELTLRLLTHCGQGVNATAQPIQHTVDTLQVKHLLYNKQLTTVISDSHIVVDQLGRQKVIWFIPFVDAWMADKTV